MLEAITQGVQPPPNVSATDQRSGWDVRPAQKIWHERSLQIFRLSQSGSWLNYVAWEVLAHETVHELDDRNHYEWTGSLVAGNSEKVIVPELVRLHYCTAIICLNLACAQPKYNCLQRTSDELTRQALRHTASLELPPMNAIYLNHGQAIGACCLYTRTAFAEAWARANRVKKAWYFLYLAFIHLQPSDAGPDWAQAQIRRGHLLKQRYMIRASRDGEDGNERWIKDPNFRARFFRGYTKSEIVPLIKQKFGEEAGAFFRDAVPRKVTAWVRKHKGSLRDARM